MYINRTTNRVPIRTVPAKASNSVKQDGFGDVLKSSAKDTFKASSVSNMTDMGGLLGIANTQAKLDKISSAIKDTDYSGMTKTEIYADIEGKYTNAFDDFYATFAVWSCEEYNMLHCHFCDDVENNVGLYWENNDTLKARGYIGMSYDEVEATIKEKYLGKTSFIDQLNLFGELFSSGVLSNKFGWDNATDMVSKLNSTLEFGSNGNITKSEWFSMIEQTKTSSPFSLLLNNPYLSLADKELFKLMVDDILSGNEDKKQ